jgi:site-specific DNA-methyltransferase (adenine-specific)
LVAAADQTLAWIESNLPAAPEDEPDGVPEPAAAAVRVAFEGWLFDWKGGESWEPRKVSGYLARLIAEKAERDAARAQREAERVAEQFVVEGWHHGDWSQVMHDRTNFPNAELDDWSVNLLLTDPPYGQGFQSDYRLNRSKDRKHDRIANDATPDEAEKQLALMLEAFYPKLALDAHLLIFCSWAGEPGMRDVITRAGYTVRGSLVWDKQATGMGDPTTTFAPAHERIIHAVKGSPKLYYRAADILRHPRTDSSRHPTEKPVPLLQELIEATTVEGQLVVDPFGGVASTAVAAKASGRRWWSVELEEKYYTAGEERLS